MIEALIGNRSSILPHLGVGRALLVEIGEELAQIHEVPSRRAVRGAVVDRHGAGHELGGRWCLGEAEPGHRAGAYEGERSVGRAAGKVGRHARR